MRCRSTKAIRARSPQVEQLATIHEYIQEFDHNGTVPSKMLFSSYVSCHLISLFGMKEFGGGEHYHQGIQEVLLLALHHGLHVRTRDVRDAVLLWT